jgi:hypothetical protein
MVTDITFTAFICIITHASAELDITLLKTDYQLA